MAVIQLAVAPAGRIDPAEVQAALHLVARAFKSPVELRDALPLPRGTEDVARGQHKAAALLTSLRLAGGRAKKVTFIGEDDSGVEGTGKACLVLVTDVDMYTPDTEFVFSLIAAASGAGLVSVKRMREAFYRRKSDPDKQKARLAKEILRCAGQLVGMPECGDPRCGNASTRNLQDLDTKKVRLCAPCWRRLSTGTMSI
jgi:predicted Zn-dependent protease